MTKLLILAPILIILVIVNQARRERAMELDEETGCVACGSEELEVRGDRVLCLECGYEGAADRGGKLTAEERNATSLDRPR